MGFRLWQPDSLDKMLLPFCVMITAFLAVPCSADNFIQNATKALECPQNLVVSNRINDRNFMKKQIDCMMNPLAKCDDIGRKAKRIGPLMNVVAAPSTTTTQGVRLI